MGLKVKIEHSASLKDLTIQYPEFKFLEQIEIKEREEICWNINGETCFDIQVMFIGKTGYGKSSTINRIVGTDVFQTSDITACTKGLYSAEYQISNSNHYFSINDLPGIGESESADASYYEWYRDMLSRSHCVVYLLRADQRDYSLDEILFQSMFREERERKKVIIALNFADKVEPLNRQGVITREQKEHLEKKLLSVKKLFGISRVIYYSAEQGTGLKKLVKEIADVVYERLK